MNNFGVCVLLKHKTNLFKLHVVIYKYKIRRKNRLEELRRCLFTILANSFIHFKALFYLAGELQSKRKYTAHF